MNIGSSLGAKYSKGEEMDNITYYYRSGSATAEYRLRKG